MRSVEVLSDKLAIILSLACVAHCFLTPSIPIIAFGLFPLSVDNEFIHRLILLVAFPISFFALVKGYTVHKTSSVVTIALCGLALLAVAVILGENILGEAGEKGLTFLGSVLVATAHYKNYQICKLSYRSRHEE